MNRRVLSFLLGIMVTGTILSAGCAHNQLVKIIPMVDEEQYLNHRVRWRGETLIRISWWYTGSGSNWRHIADENPALNIRHIKIGDVIHIPEALVITHDLMPEEYRIPVSVQQEKIPVTRPVQRGTQGSLDLYGPVDTRSEKQPPEADASLPLQTIDER